MNMYDGFRNIKYQRAPRRGIEWGQVFGWGLCGVAVTYLFAAALLGLLAS